MEDILMAEQNDFLKPLLDMMSGRMDRLEQKIDASTAMQSKILEHSEHVDDQIDEHGKTLETLTVELSRLQKQGYRKLDLSPNIMYLIAVGAVLLLAIVAALLHVNIGGFFRG